MNRLFVVFWMIWLVCLFICFKIVAKEKRRAEEAESAARSWAETQNPRALVELEGRQARGEEGGPYSGEMIILIGTGGAAGPYLGGVGAAGAGGGGGLTVTPAGGAGGGEAGDRCASGPGVTIEKLPKKLPKPQGTTFSAPNKLS